MKSEGMKVISASKEYIDAVAAAGYDVSGMRPKQKEIGTNCTGTHRFFVANDAAFEGRVTILLVCTSCGEGKRVDFEVASKSSSVEVNK